MDINNYVETFFPPSKNTKARVAIIIFVQGIDEALSKVWERYKVLLKKYLNHGFKRRYRCIYFEMDFNYRERWFWILLLVTHFYSRLQRKQPSLEFVTSTDLRSHMEGHK